MHQFRDVSHVAGVAHAKSSNEIEDQRARAQLFDQTGTIPGVDSFANPEENVRKMGVTEGNCVADLGAGSGAYTLALARAVGHAGVVYAVDVQKALLARIKNAATQQHLDTIETVWGNIEEPQGTHLKAALVDVALLSNVLFQVDDREALLREAKRIVKPTGTVVIIDWEDSFNGMGPHKNDVVTKDQALALAKGAGLTWEREFPAGAHHYGLVFRIAA